MLSTFSNGATTASVQGNQTYGPYGNKLSSAGSMGTAKGFTGQYSDPTGLDYYNARYYDPVLGRFLSADVVQSNLQGMDPYAYVSDNPETWNDPTGQCGGFLDIGCNIQQGLNNTWNATKQVGTTVGKAVGQAADFVLGISSSIQDVHTLFDSKASAWDKVFAGVDLAVNVVTDALMVTGIGEAIKSVSIVGKLGVKLLVDAGKNLVKSEAKKVVADEFSHVVDQSFVDAAKQGVKTATQDAAKTATQDVAQAACGGGLSFIFTTQVATAQGEQAIGNLKVGQKVWSYNPQTQKMELQPILHVWINHDNDLVDLTIASTVPGKKGHVDQQTTEVIHTNKKHPFLTQEAGFVMVASLNVGMHVVEADGNVGVITGWTVVPGTMTMYNLEVAQDHTFTVGDGQWVVHNSTGDCVRTVAQAIGDIKGGAENVTVATRADAEQIFLRQFNGAGYLNTTGDTKFGVQKLFETLEGTYHWDEMIDANLKDEARLMGHGKGNPDAYQRHLQIHPFGWDGSSLHIFFGPYFGP